MVSGRCFRHIDLSGQLSGHSSIDLYRSFIVSTGRTCLSTEIPFSRGLFIEHILSNLLYYSRSYRTYRTTLPPFQAVGNALSSDERPQRRKRGLTGHRWQEQLESGEYAGLDDLAQAVGVVQT